jgi:hypothetical protein
MTDIDDSLINWLAGGGFNENFEFEMKEMELKKNDWRKSKARTIDINSQYSEFRAFAATPEFKHTQIATELLSRDFDTSGTQLKLALQSNYGLSDGECRNVIKNLANSRNVEFKVNSYTKAIKLRRK